MVNRLVANGNAYLSSVPDRIARTLLPELSLVELGQHRSPSNLFGDGYVYFPLTSVLAVTVGGAEGDEGFFWLSGRNDVCGLRSPILDRSGVLSALAPQSVFRVSVLGDGAAMRIASDRLWSILGPYGRDLYAKIGLALVADISSMNAHCCAAHGYRNRVARLLLDATAEFPVDASVTLTHERIAGLLLTRRETVSGFLEGWARAGIIETGRGSIRVLDIAGLRAVSCACVDRTSRTRARALGAWRLFLEGCGSRRVVEDAPVGVSPSVPQRLEPHRPAV